jgi:16S rRNA (uracil1498-N3)-methyltransferase
MKLHRFYVAGEIPLQGQGAFDIADKNLVNQLKNVFRLRTGDKVIVFNGDGQDSECLIKGFQKDKVQLEIQALHPSRYIPTQGIWLCTAIVKKDTFEWIAEKATELGVSHIIPIVSERSEKKSLNMERLEKIVIEASEQSGRGTIPTIHPIVTLVEAINQVKGSNYILAFHTEGELFQDDVLDKEKSIALFIGPEGGWSEKEVDLFHVENIPVKSIGKQVLRAETAAIAVLAKIVF